MAQAVASWEGEVVSCLARSSAARRPTYMYEASMPAVDYRKSLRRLTRSQYIAAATARVKIIELQAAVVRRLNLLRPDADAVQNVGQILAGGRFETRRRGQEEGRADRKVNE